LATVWNKFCNIFGHSVNSFNVKQNSNIYRTAMTAIWAILALIQSRFNVFGFMVGNGTQTNRKVTFLCKTRYHFISTILQ